MGISLAALLVLFPLTGRIAVLAYSITESKLARFSRRSRLNCESRVASLPNYQNLGISHSSRVLLSFPSVGKTLPGTGRMSDLPLRTMKTGEVYHGKNTRTVGTL